MKAIFSPRRLFALGFALILAANAFVLWSVYANRFGEPEARVELTERELSLPYYYPEENTGVILNLQWRVLSKKTEWWDYGFNGHWGNPEWFTEQKLAELGFDVEKYKKSTDDFKKYQESVPKEVFVVLEADSGLHATAIERAEKVLVKAQEQLAENPEDKENQNKVKDAENMLEREKIENSRLFAIDAGLEAKRLRLKYPDRSRYIITRGLVEPRRTFDKSEEEVAGYISRLSNETVYVPLEHRKILDALGKEAKPLGRAPMGPRYSVQLAYGSRFEPWIVSVDKFTRIQINPKNSQK